MARPFQAVTTLSSRPGCGRAGAGGEQPRRASSATTPASSRVGAQLQRRGAVLEGARVGDAEQRGGPLAVVRAEHLDELGGRPGVGQALDARRCRRRARRRTRPRRCAGRAAGSRRSRAATRSRERVAGGPPQVQRRRAAAARCRRASSRSAARPRRRRRSSGRSRRRAGRTCRRGPSPRRCRRPSPARRRRRCGRGGAAGTPAPSTAGTSARRRSRRAPRRTGREPAPRPGPGRSSPIAAGRRRSHGGRASCSATMRCPLAQHLVAPLASRPRRRAASSCEELRLAGSRCRRRTARRRA